MTPKVNVTFCFVRCLIIVSTCALMSSATAPLLAYTKSDVKRGEDMVATKNFKGAIELLSGITKDFDFCAASPADAARAGMLLCDAYEGTGEQTSDAYKTVLESTKAALVQVWASTKKTEPDVKKRSDKMADVCIGHPQAFAEFLKLSLPKMNSVTRKDEMIIHLDSLFGQYMKLADAAQPTTAPMDEDLLSMAADLYTTLGDNKKAISLWNEALALISKGGKGNRINVMIQLMEAYARENDYEATISCGNRCLALELEENQNLMVRSFIIWALKGQGKFDEAIEMLKSLVKDESTAELRVLRTSEIANIYLLSSKYKQAVDVLLPIARSKRGVSDITRAQVLYNIVLCYSRLNREELALGYLQELSKSYPESMEARKALWVINKNK